ncbi:DUF262 domain-containing protein [Streptococcus cristatus]|uniref:DUF262 domain-containing protein n=1 Tax=Streptococcus cristatus TaxID=45634 RepID=UPI0005F04AA3|nr:DUF262 domain-containing protein [Streptococcus cristatus]KJQ61425.1 hypothetical protein TW70_00754 [Streptococcus cristatus]QIP50229.1 DUF262 domain-containing protein [Streptococcus cristatus ATCC 51100]
MVNFDEKAKLLEQQISDERQKLSADRMDISFGEIMNLYEQSELIIRPEYQRLFRWTNTQKTLLIESILMGIPIPPIFVAEDEDGIWELVDGLQRVSTIISFFGKLKSDLVQKHEVSDVVEDLVSNSNNWELEAGDIIKDLEGFDANTLPQKYKLNIKRAVCRVEILRGESNTSLKYELFKRLNSGGTKLTPQEIRNAVYRGINPILNELITELSQNSSFKDLTNLSETKIRELYDQELILRFVAFYQNVSNINLSTQSFLDKFMEETTSTGNLDSEMYKRVFNSTIALLTEIGDNTIFRNEQNLFVPAVFEGVMIGTSENLAYYTNHKDELREKIRQLRVDDEFKRLSGSASNSRSRIKKRLQRAQEIFSYGN